MGTVRTAKIERKTRETNVVVEVNLDGTGDFDVKTPIPFFNHMLETFSKHSGIDLKIKASGDTEIDAHHTVEDVGICLGNAISEAVGTGKGINRFGHAIIPMDESLCYAALDISGRGYLVYNVKLCSSNFVDFDSDLAKEFFQALAINSRITLHVSLQYGVNHHHILESLFKSVARAFKMAVKIDSAEYPSTKGGI